MKQVRYGLIAAMLVGLLLTGCSNFGLIFGAPTAQLSVQGYSFTYNQTSNQYELKFTLVALPLNGSPSGVIRNLNLSNGGQVSINLAIAACGPTDTCTEATKDVLLGFATPPSGEIKAVSYTAAGNNNIAREVELNPPLGLYPLF
ncbi:hypothetical protein [Calidithermus timidus]|jgi:hypothetical protein|uniref:hypothetical protein n=1 Tax=Calidithermus timidus TaxID=307124 RepID=UPI00037FEF32|nr:hypothetical protein [Calidithermus timidus]